MQRQLGEVIGISELNEGDLLWLEGAYRLVTGISEDADGRIVVSLLDNDPAYFQKDEQVMRGWWYLVARRVRR